MENDEIHLSMFLQPPHNHLATTQQPTARPPTQ
jgi:hypothetical protein